MFFLKENFYFSIFFLILFSLFLCSNDSGSGDQRGEIFGQDSVSYDVTYQDNVTIIDSLDKQALISYDTTNWQTFTFDQSSFSSVPQIGQIIVIDGLAAGKVKSIEEHGNEIILQTDSVILTDIIKDGNISWDFSPTTAQATQIMLSHNNQLMKRTDSGFEIEYEFDNDVYKIWVNPQGKSENGLDELQVNFTITNKYENQVSGVYGAKGTVRLPRQTGNVEISDSTVSNFQTQSKSSHCELTFSYVAGLSMNGGKKHLTLPNFLLKIPLQALTGIPMPIPMYINVGIDFYLYVNIPSVTGGLNVQACKLILDADTGFKLEGPSVNATYKIHDNEITVNSDWTVGDNGIQPVPIEVRFDIYFPRLSLNILNQEVAWLATGFSSRITFTVPGLEKKALNQVRCDGGYKFSVMGYDLAEGSKMFWQVSQEDEQIF